MPARLEWINLTFIRENILWQKPGFYWSKTKRKSPNPFEKACPNIIMKSTLPTTGLIGRKLFESKKYDLAILDINLPLMNGYELARHIRPSNEEILVIMLTAMNTTEDKIEGFEAGADDYIVKPFDFQELLVRIRALLKRLYHQPPSAPTF